MPVPFYGSTTNPVDTTAQVVNSPETYEKVLFNVGNSKAVDMLVAVTWAVSSPSNDALVAYYQSTDRPVAVTSTAWLDDFQRAGVPTYTDPQRAAKALGAVTALSLRARQPRRPSSAMPDTARRKRRANCWCFRPVKPLCSSRWPNRSWPATEFRSRGRYWLPTPRRPSPPRTASVVRWR